MQQTVHVCTCRLRRWVPQAKIIMLLREPVTRALSSYHHWLRHGLGSVRSSKGLGTSTSFNEYIYKELLQNTALRCQLGLPLNDGHSSQDQRHESTTAAAEGRATGRNQHDSSSHSASYSSRALHSAGGVQAPEQLALARRLLSHSNTQPDLAEHMPQPWIHGLELGHHGRKQQQELPTRQRQERSQQHQHDDSQEQEQADHNSDHVLKDEQQAEDLQAEISTALDAGPPQPAPDWQQCYQSCWRHSVKVSTEGSVTQPGPRCEGLDQDLPVSRGLYAGQLVWWRQLFPDSQLHVVSYHKLMASPLEEMARLLEYLGIGGENSSAWLAASEEAYSSGSGSSNSSAAKEAGATAEQAAVRGIDATSVHGQRQDGASDGVDAPHGGSHRRSIHGSSLRSRSATKQLSSSIAQSSGRHVTRDTGSSNSSQRDPLPQLQVHSLTADQLNGSCSALTLLARLYAQYEAPLKALLQEMGAAGAVMASEEQVGGWRQGAYALIHIAATIHIDWLGGVPLIGRWSAIQHSQCIRLLHQLTLSAVTPHTSCRYSLTPGSCWKS